MLQAAKYKKLKITALVVCLLCVLSLGVAVAAAFLNTNEITDIISEMTGILS